MVSPIGQSTVTTYLISTAHLHIRPRYRSMAADSSFITSEEFSTD